MSGKKERVFEQRGEEHCRDVASSGKITVWMPETKQILMPG